MQITILGSGTSQGVPMIGESLENPCYADKRNWRTRSSIHVQMGDLHIQVDAAQEFRLQCLSSHIRHIDLFILTHEHADHVMGMDDLRRFNGFLGGKALPVYSSPEGLNRVKAVFPYAIGCSEFLGYPSFDLRAMPAVLDLPGGQVAATPLPHGNVDVLGLIFTEYATGQKAGYFTDCSKITPEAQVLAAGAQVVILDGLRYEPHPTHMTIDEAVAAALRIGAPLSYLTHLSSGLDHATLEASLPAGVRVAYDTLIIDCSKG